MFWSHLFHRWESVFCVWRFQFQFTISNDFNSHCCIIFPTCLNTSTTFLFYFSIGAVQISSTVHLPDNGHGPLSTVRTLLIHCPLVMSIGNQKFGISRKYQNQIGIWYFCPKFLGIFLVFSRNFVNVLVKIWLHIGILGQNKIVLVFGVCVCHFIGIGLVSVCHFPENDVSTVHRPDTVNWASQTIISWDMSFAAV